MSSWKTTYQGPYYASQNTRLYKQDMRRTNIPYHEITGQGNSLNAAIKDARKKARLFDAKIKQMERGQSR